MSQASVSKPEIVGHEGLDARFWAVAAGLTAVNVIIVLAILFGHVDFFLPGASNEVADRAADVDALFKFMAAFGSAIFVYVSGFVVYFAFAFRRPAGEALSTIGVQIHDAPKLETWWTVLPTLLLVALTGMSIAVWYKIQFGTGAAPALTMEVVAHQFQFEYRYPGLEKSIFSTAAGTLGADPKEALDDEHAMHLPVGKTVRLLISSADVLHNFWVPEIRLKAGAVPGLVQNLNFTPTKTGTYDVVCAEFCGVNHSYMQGKLIIESPEDFDAWLTRQKTGAKASSGMVAAGSAEAGKATFAAHCAACHSLGGFDQKIVGPGLGHLMHDPAHATLVTGDPPGVASIEKILTNGFSGPLGMMPNQAANGISNQDIANLAAFLTSQK